MVVLIVPARPVRSISTRTVSHVPTDICSIDYSKILFVVKIAEHGPLQLRLAC